MANTKEGTVQIAGAGTSPDANKKLYDDWAQKYEQDVRSWGYRMPEECAETLKKYAPAGEQATYRVLDAGAGDGLSGKAITDQGFKEVVGIDLSPELIKIAEKNGIYKKAEVADMSKPLKYKTDEFDAMTIVGVMTYLEPDCCSLAEMCRVVKPGGLVIMTHRTDKVDKWAPVQNQMVKDGKWEVVNISEPRPYLPQNPEYADKIKVIIHTFRVCKYADDKKVSDLIASSKPGWFSFEYFPPKTEDGVNNLRKRIVRMKGLNPLFTDFTWGAGGSTSDLSLQLTHAAKNEFNCVANMHLTCTNQKSEMCGEALDACKQLGVRNIVALRGDAPRGQETWTATEGGFSCALDLVKYINKNYGSYFSVSVAGYPEGHPDNIEEVANKADLSAAELRRARIVEDENGKEVITVCRDANFKKEMVYLKEKVDAGAHFVITQMFLDAQVYLDFVVACKEYGINVPIVPGIMCLNNLGGLQRMTALCKTRLPAGLMERAKAANTSDDGFKAFGIQEGVAMCKALLAGGAPGLHFYTLNLERVVVGVLVGLGLVSEEQAKCCTTGDADAKTMVSAQGITTGTTRPPLPGNRPLKEVDPVMAQYVADEKERQIRCIELIASENFTSRAVMECLGSALTNKYSEGQPNARYYGGNEVIDKVENLCKDRALKAFGLDEKQWGVNVQPYSGSPANFAVYTAMLPPHSRVMGLDLPSGGHLTHGYYTARKKISATSIYFESLPYKVHPETGLIDFDALRESALVYRPQMILCGASAYPRVVDFAKFRQIADEVGALLMADIAHISGLVATGCHPAPFEHCDIVTTTTHKSLRGPRSGMIFFKYQDKFPDIKERIDMAVFPGLQGGPHNHQIGALACQLLEVATPEFKEYSKQVCENAKALGEALITKGHKLASGGTDNHLLLWDLRPHGLTGGKVEKVCDFCNITLNKNCVAGDVSALSPGGVRIGTPAMTTRGCKKDDMLKIADFLDRTVQIALKVQEKVGKKLKDFEAELPANAEVKALKQEVNAWASTFGYPGL